MIDTKLFRFHHLEKWKHVGNRKYGIERRFYLGEWVITRVYIGVWVYDFHRYEPEYWL